jgi:hypothetical protein
VDSGAVYEMGRGGKDRDDGGRHGEGIRCEREPMVEALSAAGEGREGMEEMRGLEGVKKRGCAHRNVPLPASYREEAVPNVLRNVLF